MTSRLSTSSTRTTPTARSSTFFQNDAYKQKIRTAIGAGQGPVLIYGWGGGGNLKAYVEAGQGRGPDELADSTPAVKDRYIKAVWEAAKVDDKVYALAGNCSQPTLQQGGSTSTAPRPRPRGTTCSSSSSCSTPRAWP